MPTASTDLSTVLVERVIRVARISGSTPGMRHRVRSDRIDDVLMKARLAIVGGDAQAQQEALLSVELLSLELCEE